MRTDADNRQDAPQLVPCGPGLRTYLRRLSRLLLAARCAGCERPLPMQAQTAQTAATAAPGRTGIHKAAHELESWCPDCQGKLVWSPAVSSPTGHTDTPWRLHAVDYLDPIPTVVASMKFGQQLWASRALAELLMTAFPDSPPIDVLVPIPLGRARLRERGFNQAHVLAKHLGARWQCGVLPTALLRRHDTDAQSRLNKTARADNMADAFEVNPSVLTSLRGRRIGLIDDVYTTGATLRAAAASLQQAGCADLGMITVARTP